MLRFHTLLHHRFLLENVERTTDDIIVLRALEDLLQDRLASQKLVFLEVPFLADSLDHVEFVRNMAVVLLLV